jgi:hypothetical protein
MNPVFDLSLLERRFTVRLSKLHAEALSDPSRLDRYCTVAISQLDNFLRAYFLSLRKGAVNSSGIRPSLGKTFPSDTELLIEMKQLGAPKHHLALHNPSVFLKVAQGLGCSNIGTIQAAMIDSWKVDVLRDVRNYFSHRCITTEQKAIQSVKKHYSVNQRAAKIILETDRNIAQAVIDDIQQYLSDFARNIT